MDCKNSSRTSRGAIGAGAGAALGGLFGYAISRLSRPEEATNFGHILIMAAAGAGVGGFMGARVPQCALYARW